MKAGSDYVKGGLPFVKESSPFTKEKGILCSNLQFNQAIIASHDW